MVGGATHFDSTCCTVPLVQLPTCWSTWTVSPSRIWVPGRRITGPEPVPTCTRFTNTLIVASDTNSRTVIALSPFWIGATTGARSAEHGWTTPFPGGLTGSPGQSHCSQANDSPAAKAGLRPTRCLSPQVRQTPRSTPLRRRRKCAPWPRSRIVSCWLPSCSGSNVGVGNGVGPGPVRAVADGGLGSLQSSAHPTTSWPLPYAGSTLTPCESLALSTRPTSAPFAVIETLQPTSR